MRASGTSLSQVTPERPWLSAELIITLKLVVVIMVSMGFMWFDHRTAYLQPVRGVLATLVYPLQRAISFPIDAGQRLHHLWVDQQTLIHENQRLRHQQLLLNAQIQRLTALEVENRRLRTLLDSATQMRERVLIAELLTVDSDPYRHRILLNRGQKQGVQVGQPLLDQRGVVGQIVHANPLSSTAILITDPNHALPVQVNRNGLRTLAVGTGNYQRLELPYVPNNYDIQVGDVLMTSGMGGRFPRGYPVGVVTAVEFDPGSPFARIDARPAVELDRIREVLVLDVAPDYSNDALSATAR